MCRSDIAVNASIDSEIQAFKYANLPASLFKYREVNTYSIQNLQTNTVWCSEIDQFNDPYDSSLCFDIRKNLFNDKFLKYLNEHYSDQGEKQMEPGLWDHLIQQGDPLKNILEYELDKSQEKVSSKEIDEIYSAFKTVLGNRMKEMVSYFNGMIKEKIRICSFSSRVDSILMWSLYSNHHKGFVLEYDFRSLSESDIRVQNIWPVIYNEKLLNISDFLINAEDTGIVNKYLQILAAIHKHIDWKYEEEWRIVAPYESGQPSCNMFVPKPKALYLGSKFDGRKTEEKK